MTGRMSLRSSFAGRSRSMTPRPINPWPRPHTGGFLPPQEPRKFPKVELTDMHYTCTGQCGGVYPATSIKWLNSEPICRACLAYARKVSTPLTPENLLLVCKCGHSLARHVRERPNMCSQCNAYCMGFTLPEEPSAIPPVPPVPDTSCCTCGHLKMSHTPAGFCVPCGQEACWTPRGGTTKETK
jgi:hypothetical protein